MGRNLLSLAEENDENINVPWVMLGVTVSVEKGSGAGMVSRFGRLYLSSIKERIIVTLILLFTAKI